MVQYSYIRNADFGELGAHKDFTSLHLVAVMVCAHRLGYRLGASTGIKNTKTMNDCKELLKSKKIKDIPLGHALFTMKEYKNGDLLIVWIERPRT